MEITPNRLAIIRRALKVYRGVLVDHSITEISRHINLNDFEEIKGLVEDISARIEMGTELD